MTTLKTLDRTPRLSELKVTYKRVRRKGRGREETTRPITAPVKAADYIRTIWDGDTIELREDFLLVCLDASLSVLGWVRLHTGGIDSSPIDPRLLFGIALKAASAGILVAHNHPSGKLDPSEQDVTITRRLAQGAKLLGLRFVDHIIVGRSGYFSFAEAGMLSD